MHDVILIPGDGIGPEITKATRRVIDASGVAITWHELEAGERTLETKGTVLPDYVIDEIAACQVALKGPLTTPIGSGFRSVNVALRKALDLYVNLRPARTFPRTGSRYEDIDIVIVRENTEDIYAGIEFGLDDPRTHELLGEIERLGDYESDALRRDSGLSIKLLSRFGSERIVRWAFEYAKAQDRKKVCAVHKANIMKESDGLFLREATAVAKSYEGVVAFEDRIVDAACMNLVLHPEDFDVLVLPNLYGDIVSDLAAGLVGGLGLAPGANIGDKVALFEPVHGSAPKHAGKDRANPTAQILSATMMLKHLGYAEEALAIEDAIAHVLEEGTQVTADIMRTRTGSDTGAVGTHAFADAVIAAMHKE